MAGVTPDSPAAKAGIQDGDVILKFDGKDVTTMRGLPRLVAQTPIGKDGRRRAASQGPEKDAEGRGRAPRRGRRDRRRPTVSQEQGKDRSPRPDTLKPTVVIGLVLAPLTDELRTKYNIDAKLKGVIVLEVDPASRGRQKSVKVGDVIVEAAQETVSTPDDVSKSIEKVKKAGRKAVLLRIEDAKGDMRFVAVPLT